MRKTMMKKAIGAMIAVAAFAGTMTVPMAEACYDCVDQFVITTQEIKSGYTGSYDGMEYLVEVRESFGEIYMYVEGCMSKTYKASELEGDTVNFGSITYDPSVLSLEFYPAGFTAVKDLRAETIDTGSKRTVKFKAEHQRWGLEGGLVFSFVLRNTADKETNLTLFGNTYRLYDSGSYAHGTGMAGGPGYDWDDAPSFDDVQWVWGTEAPATTTAKPETTTVTTTTAATTTTEDVVLAPPPAPVPETEPEHAPAPDPDPAPFPGNVDKPAVTEPELTAPPLPKETTTTTAETTTAPAEEKKEYSRFDVNRDGKVDFADLIAWLTGSGVSD